MPGSGVLGFGVWARSAVVFGQNTAASLAAVLAANSVFGLRGYPAQTSVGVRSFGVLVPSAMGRAGAKYREWAFSLGCRNKPPGNPAFNKSL
jgi:hypothetical protein